MRDDTLHRILDIGIAFSREKNKESLLERILSEAIELTQCDGGTLYINKGKELEFKIMITKSRGIHQGGGGEPITMPPVPLLPENVCACGVLYRRLINIPDVYESTKYDFSGPKRYDALNGYRTTSMMVVPMEDDKENIIGVMQLINALDEAGNVVAFDKSYERILLSLGSQAAICLVNMSYAHQIQSMLDSFVKVMSTAIDARTPYNANHTKNMVIYGSRFIDWLNEQHMDWSFSEEEKRVFLMTVWLHDIGKLVTPQEIMDKQDRLGSNYNRLMARLEKIHLLTRIDQMAGRLTQEEADNRQKLLVRVREQVEEINQTVGMTKEQEAVIEEIAALTYTDENGSIQTWITPEEHEQLLIRNGTLTKSERDVMQKHVIMTQRMLEQMSFDNEFRNVPTWAAQHHEMINGSGYPLGLKGDEICREVRLLSILDIFEALTARDRPYKPPMPVEKSFEILYKMADRQELDIDILRIFEQSKAWT